MYKSGQLLVEGPYVLHISGDLHTFLGLPARVEVVWHCFLPSQTAWPQRYSQAGLKKTTNNSNNDKKIPKASKHVVRHCCHKAQRWHSLGVGGRRGELLCSPGMQRMACKLESLMKPHWCPTAAIIWLKSGSNSTNFTALLPALNASFRKKCLCSPQNTCILTWVPKAIISILF